MGWDNKGRPERTPVEELAAYLKTGGGWTTAFMVKATEKPAILIIDDEVQIRDLLSDLLSPAHDCTTVGSAEEALAILSSINFDLVISDINMGGISGIDLVPLVL